MPPQSRPVIRVKVRISSQDFSREETLDLTVDPTSIYSWIPAEVGARIGILFPDRRRLRRPEGSIVERTVGQVHVGLEGKQGMSFVVLAESGDSTVLGELTLTSLGLEVDPNTNALREIEWYYALAAAT